MGGDKKDKEKGDKKDKDKSDKKDKDKGDKKDKEKKDKKTVFITRKHLVKMLEEEHQDRKAAGKTVKLANQFRSVHQEATWILKKYSIARINQYMEPAAKA